MGWGTLPAQGSGDKGPLGTGMCMACAGGTTVEPGLPCAGPDPLCSPHRGYKAERPQQDPLPTAGSLGAPSPSCPPSAASGHAEPHAAPRALPLTPETCQPPTASTATSMSTLAPPSHAPCQPRAPHRLQTATAAGGCPRPASFKNSIQLWFCFKEKTEFLTDFYIPRTPDPLPPTRTCAH